jgi:tRNA threonylcarbamoyladenosine biosynthesis protein TsaE
MPVEAPLDSRAQSRSVALADAGETVALGKKLGARLQLGDVVCLWGGLGAGKTTFARGAIAAWTGLDQDVPSPTYTLVQTYDGPRGQLLHMDLYRLKSSEEAWELGLEEAFVDGVSLIEWPERLEALLPRNRLDIAFAGQNGPSNGPSQDSGTRLARLTAYGNWRGRIDDI